MFVAPFPFALTAPLHPFCKVAPFPVFLCFLVAIKAQLESQSQITVEPRSTVLRENMEFKIRHKIVVIVLSASRFLSLKSHSNNSYLI